MLRESEKLRFAVSHAHRSTTSPVLRAGAGQERAGQCEDRSVSAAPGIPAPGPGAHRLPAAGLRAGSPGPWGDDAPLSASLPQKLAVRSCPAAVLVGGGSGGSAKPGGVPALLKAPGSGGGSPGGGPAQSLAISVVPAKAPIAMVTAHLNGGLGGGGGEPPQSAPINLQTTGARRPPELGARAQVTAEGGRGGPHGGAGREAGGAGSDRAGGGAGVGGGRAAGGSAAGRDRCLRSAQRRSGCSGVCCAERGKWC